MAISHICKKSKRNKSVGTFVGTLKKSKVQSGMRQGLQTVV